MDNQITISDVESALHNTEFIKTKYYYIRDWANAPEITLCFIRTRNSHTLLSVGVAVCSYKDMPNKEIGKRIAQGRAWKNIGNGVVFSQHELKDCSIVKYLLNYRYDRYKESPWHVKKFMELMEFELEDYRNADLPF